MSFKRWIYLLVFVVFLFMFPIYKIWNFGEKAHLKVVCTNDIIADVVAKIAGDSMAIKVSTDLSVLDAADIIFYNGLGFESKMDQVLSGYEAKGKTVVVVTSAIPRDKLMPSRAFASGYDPRVWLDVTLWMYAVESIRDTLISYSPSHRELYMERAEQFLNKMGLLHTYIREESAKLSSKARVIYVSQPEDFGYFENAYGLTFGFGTMPVGTVLYVDSLGPEHTFEGSYLGMMKHNIDVFSQQVSSK